MTSKPPSRGRVDNSATPRRVTLTKAEREWLGATVRQPDGRTGQVWALHPERGYVWVVSDGACWPGIHVSELTRLERWTRSAVDD